LQYSDIKVLGPGVIIHRGDHYQVHWDDSWTGFENVDFLFEAHRQKLTRVQRLIRQNYSTVSAQRRLERVQQHVLQLKDYSGGPGNRSFGMHVDATIRGLQAIISAHDQRHKTTRQLIKQLLTELKESCTT